ncbi:cytochrome-c peroxidase [Polyangium mundeleinium]|uniref:Cytochrome c peroxidase n=1 Tax=Polyangium mundeleinium TaxID=2995306 RepID=A0ABT5EHZ7_9BACT|nr:cytochrome c peroxidase [Polyangium mundeleinium]MDC0741450.1 cytochrome c peroxidase [Polyangium mundeleinium]
MPAKRSTSPERLSALVLAALLLAGCPDEPEGPAPADASAKPVVSTAPPEPPPSPLTRVVEEPARRGLEALESLVAAMPQGRGDTNSHYLALRRSLAAGAPIWRRPESLGGEVVFGPPRSIDEGGGALLRLDAALVLGDAAAARIEMVTLDRALRLFQSEARRIPTVPGVVAHALSLAAYDLGALALESFQGVPEGSAAVLADLRGTLDFIESASAALANPGTAETPAALESVKQITRPLRARLDAAKTADDLDDRASFVLATGRLGAALRRLVAAAGLPVRMPYRARFPVAKIDADEPVSALTLPAPRIRPRGASGDEATWAALGRKLFFDKRLSKNNARSCVTCHVPEKGFADGLVRPPSLDPAVTLRHTPTLLYAPLHAAQLWDGRALTPERQALGVIRARAEMGLETDELLRAIETAADLRTLFQALPTPGVTTDNVGRALAAFESEAFVPGDAPIDLFARGDEPALSPLHRRGLDVFAGKGRCARCHIPPFFGGSRPLDFAVPIFAVLGVPDKPGGTTLDPDRGRGAFTSRPADEGAFKTPTTRDVARTAPYFHHGAFRTLEEVVDFYDKGGGKGLGIPVPNQDPDVRALGLSADEKRALLAFLREALLDKTPPEKLASPPR